MIFNHLVTASELNIESIIHPLDYFEQVHFPSHDPLWLERHRASQPECERSQQTAEEQRPQQGGDGNYETGKVALNFFLWFLLSSNIVSLQTM